MSTLMSRTLRSIFLIAGLVDTVYVRQVVVHLVLVGVHVVLKLSVRGVFSCFVVPDVF